MLRLLPFFFMVSEASTMDAFVVGGQQASIKQWPFIAFLEAHISETGRMACGGSLISSQTVLTAAHCTDDVTESKKLIDSVVFTIFMGHATLSQATMVRKVLDYISHERYHPSDSFVQHDISIMILEKPVEFSHTVKKAILVQDPSSLHDNQVMSVAGWGRINTNNTEFSPFLKSVNMRGMTYSKCDEISLTHVAKDRVICTYPSREFAYCGDSGGPLVRNSDFYLVGLVSFRDAESGITFFTSVPSYYDWIQTTQRKLFKDVCTGH